MHGRSEWTPSPRSGGSGLAGLLRQRTAHAHRAAESAMRLDFQHPDPSDYLAVLNSFMAFHTAVAEFSDETVASELGSDMALPSRRHALRADITSMSQRLPAAGGMACESNRSPDGPVPAHQLRGGREERIGAAYVAAGSVLGGRVIAANLAASRSGGDFPRSFFASEGLEVGRLWRQFRTALDDFGESGTDTTRVIAGALAGFALIREILSAPDAVPGPA
jgi:heme oxygenase